MDEQEKEEILNRLDVKTDNLQENQKDIRADVRANRDIYTEQINNVEDKAHSNGEKIAANTVRIAGGGILLTSLLGIALSNAGLLPI